MSGRFYPTSYEGKALPADGGSLASSNAASSTPLTFPQNSLSSGFQSPNVNVYTIDLSVVRESFEITLTGNVFWVQNGTDLTSTADIAFGSNSQVGNKFSVSKGLFIRGVNFTSIFVTNTSQAAKTLTIITVNDASNTFNVENILTSAGSGGGSSSSSSVSETSDLSVAASTTAEILAENTNRISALITNISSNTTEFRIGGSTSVGAAKGIPLTVGQTVTLETTSAIYGYNSHTSAQSLAIVELV